MKFTALDKLVLSNFSSIEKECIYQVVCAAMVVDGERDPEEYELIKEIIDIIGLTREEREESRQLDEPTLTKTILDMNDLQRAYVAKFIAHMLYADGKVTNHEEAFFNILLDKLNLPKDPDNL